MSNIYTFIERHMVKQRRALVTAVFTLQVVVANYIAYLLRFEFTLPHYYLEQMAAYLPALIIIRIASYLYSGLYRDLWRYAGIGDLIKILESVTIGSLAFYVLVRIVVGDMTYPQSVFILDWLLVIMFAGGSRLLIRVFKEYLYKMHYGCRVLLIGAGDAGEMLVRDMKNSHNYSYVPIGFIDSDPYKKGLTIHGVPIFGSQEVMADVIEKHKPEEIVISIPSASYKTIRNIYEFCRPFNLPIKTLPGLSDILNGSVSVSHIMPLSLEDLLKREPLRTDIDSVREYIKGKSVLVTGAGGSIGSELARQIAEYGPSALVLLDRYENGLFKTDYELRGKHEKRLHTIIGDMLDHACIENVFSKFRPNIVFHAAAHKHVPLMELNPLEAVKNNIFGTRNIIRAASEYGVDSFVMISTDKAVNPTSIMGATKRVAEFLAIKMNSSTRFVTVRFGNVLGSNGSVVNTFEEQLKQGGPLTVTHPEMRRFFMLIPEAVQLVLIASSIGDGGEIFVLDMGEPVRIVDFAENFIKLSGFVPYEDIGIEFIGMRRGEKLYEELFDESEEIVPTSHEKLRMAFPQKTPSVAELCQHMAALENIVANNAADEVVPVLQKIIPGFKEPNMTSVSDRQLSYI